MRIRVIEEKCQGHARCFALAPDVFDVDDYGQSSAKNEGVVPPSLEEKVRLAIENCPEFAIEVLEP